MLFGHLALAAIVCYQTYELDHDRSERCDCIAAYLTKVKGLKQVVLQSIKSRLDFETSYSTISTEFVEMHLLLLLDLAFSRETAIAEFVQLSLIRRFYREYTRF